MFSKDTYAGNGTLDFLFPMPDGRPLRVLQLTDIQTMDLTCTRNATRDRQIKGAYFKNGVYGMEERAYGFIRSVIRAAAPDLIVLTGDNVYGEFDDNGRMLCELIECMEEAGIPWAPTFGNHDNESRMGVDWQCEQFAAAPHCLFSRGSVTGNANFSIGLVQGGAPKFALILLDTNGCHIVGNPVAPEEGLTLDNPCYDKLENKNYIAPDQIDWYRHCVAGLPNMVFLHIPPICYIEALQARYGFEFGSSVTLSAPDTGAYVEQMRFSDFTDADGAFFKALQACDCRAVFAGHQHLNDCILRDWQGVTLGYGLKTGYNTYWRRGSTGGTLHEIHADGSVRHTHIVRT